MKWSEAYEHAGQTIAVPVKLIHAIGAKGAILIAQLFYWKGRERSTEGWVYKTKEELRRETGISIKEQRKCVEELKKMGVLETKYDRLEHRLNYRIHIEMLDKIMEADLPSEVPKGHMLRAHAQKADGTGPKGTSRSDQKADRHIDQRLLPKITTTKTMNGEPHSPVKRKIRRGSSESSSFSLSGEGEKKAGRQLLLAPVDSDDLATRLATKGGLSDAQKEKIAMHIDHSDEGRAFVLQCEAIADSEPRENWGRTFMAAFRDKWKPRVSTIKPKPPKPKSEREPIKEPTLEEWEKGRQLAATMKAAVQGR